MYKVVRNITAKEREEYSYLGDAIVYNGWSFPWTDVHKAALKAALKDRSNPFAYAKAVSEMRNGHQSPEHY